MNKSQIIAIAICSITFGCTSSTQKDASYKVKKDEETEITIHRYILSEPELKLRSELSSKGDLKSVVLVANHYFFQNKIKEATEWLNIAASRGHKRSMVYLASILERNDNKHDCLTAKEWILKAYLHTPEPEGSLDEMKIKLASIENHCSKYTNEIQGHPSKY